MEEKRDSLPTGEHDGAATIAHNKSRRTNLFHRVFLGILLVIVITLWYPDVRGTVSKKVTSCGKHGGVEARARKLLKENPLIDGHNDLAIWVRGTYKNHIYGNEFQEKFENGGLGQHVDIPRLKQGLQGGAFWSAFWPCPLGDGTNFSDERYHNIVQGTLGQLDLLHRLRQQYPKLFTPTQSYHDAVKQFASGHLISPFAIEGLHQIGNSVSNLRLYHQLGVRYATLTWNCHNKYADAALETGENFAMTIAKPYWHGLSPAGRDLVKEMNRLGMLVDLSHVSEDTMRDVLVGKGDDGKWNGSLAPPIFSHSSAYAICPHPRNVKDEVLQLVKQRNAVVMVNFSPDFISCVSGKADGDLPISVPENATLHQVVRHITHIGELIGYDHVGIGTDYDGIETTPTGLEDVSKFPDLISELLRQGVKEKDVVKVIGGNVLRVWKDVDRAAKELQKTIVPLEDNLNNSW